MKNSTPRWGGGPAKRALQVALPLVLLGVSKAALADTTILDHLASSYQSRLLTTTGIFLDFAKRLFYLLATIELAGLSRSGRWRKRSSRASGPAWSRR